jgi:hypothetical protein
MEVGKLAFPHDKLNLDLNIPYSPSLQALSLITIWVIFVLNCTSQKHSLVKACEACNEIQFVKNPVVDGPGHVGNWVK